MTTKIKIKQIDKGVKMNEMFSEVSRQVINFARDEARRFRHDYIGTEHLLLGLIRHDENRAIEAIRNFEIDPDVLKRSIEEVVQPCSLLMDVDVDVEKPIPLTARVKSVLEYSGQEARALKSETIEPEHILLALLKAEEGVAAQVMLSEDFEYCDAYEELSGTSDTKDPESRIKFPISVEVRDVLQKAYAEVERLRNSYTGVAHILLGLLCLKDDPVQIFLATVGIDLGEFKTELEDALLIDPRDKLRINLKKMTISIKKSTRIQSPVRLNNSAWAVIMVACRNARSRELKEIGTTCLFLAILRHGKNIPAHLLSKHGISYQSALAQLEKTL